MRVSIFSVQDHYPAKPRTVGELYREILAQAELADTLGYDTFYLAEHHFHEYGVAPDPAVMLSAMAGRTKRLRLGTSIAVLTFHSPVAVAESYAMVDQLSGGRLVLGVGSGYLKHEYEGFAVDPAIKRERFDENFALLRRLMKGERVTFKGAFNELAGVRINVPTVQEQVPMPVAVLRAEAAYYVGKQDFDMIAVPYASVDRFADVAALVGEHHRGLKEAGRADLDEASIVCFHTHVAETDDAARQRAAEAFDLYVATRLYAKRATYDDVMRSGLSLMGSVETVADKMVALHDMGVNHVMALQNFGALAATEVHRSMRLLTEQVLPRVEKKIAARRAA